jgi:guanine nucleotide-binding protein subunit alpha
MGICQSGENTQEFTRSCEIDKQLEKEKVNQEYKILLLGNKIDSNNALNILN